MERIYFTLFGFVLLFIFLVVGAYVLGVGMIGNTEFSVKAKDWVDFSSFFNSILSPLLAMLAAAIAFFSLTKQLM